MIKMKSIILSSIIILFSNCIQAQPELNIRVRIPDSWVEKVRTLDYWHPSTELIIELEKTVYPDSVFNYDSDMKGFLNPMFVNLDEDADEEMIALYGWSESSPVMLVFDRYNDEWFLIYQEPYYMWYAKPVLNVANSFGPNKTFYFRWLNDRGSGIYSDSYHFYKLINGVVYHSLGLVNESHLYGWGKFLNQKISMSFSFNGIMGDEIWVSYNYSYFAGPVLNGDVSWDSHTDIPFAQKEVGVNFKWNGYTDMYEPEFYEYDSTGLNAEKLACLQELCNDTLFVKAFQYEINQTLQEGTDQQKKLLKQYLERVEKMGNATAPDGELEQKGETESGMKFYGPKE